MNLLKSVNKQFYRAERAVAVSTFIMMILIMFIQVFFRYIVKSSLAWSEEAMRFLFILSSFFGAACCTYEKKHVVIDVVELIVKAITKDKLRKEVIYSAIDVVVSVVCSAFFAYMAVTMARYAYDLKVKNSLSASMLVPQCWIGYAIVAALALCTVHYILNLFIDVCALGDDIKKMKGGDK